MNHVCSSTSNLKFTSFPPPVKLDQVRKKNTPCISHRQYVYFIAGQSSKPGVCLSGSPSGHAMVTAAAWWVAVSSLGSYLYSRTHRYAYLKINKCFCFGFVNVEKNKPKGYRSYLHGVSPSLCLQRGAISCSLPALCGDAGGRWTVQDLHPRPLPPPGHRRLHYRF